MREYTLTDREEEQDILFGVINRFIGYFTRQAVPDTINDTTREYPFVAMDTRQAYEQIRWAEKFLTQKKGSDATFTFIDIGCGIGNILLLAEMIGFDVFGIEKDTASLKTARSLLGDKLVSKVDIWNYTELNKFDVVYYFRPFCEKKLQLAFEKQVEETIKPGAILIANRKMSNEINTDDRFRRLDNNIPAWVKR